MFIRAKLRVGYSCERLVVLKWVNTVQPVSILKQQHGLRGLSIPDEA